MPDVLFLANGMRYRQTSINDAYQKSAIHLTKWPARLFVSALLMAVRVSLFAFSRLVSALARACVLASLLGDPINLEILMGYSCCSEDSYYDFDVF